MYNVYQRKENYKMRKLDVLKKVIVAVAVVAMGVFALPAMAAYEGGVQGGVNDVDPGNSAGADNLPDVAKNVINVILYVLGILAVGFIIYGGVKYSMSAGDAAKVKSAKDTIMYAIIGLIVAILAFAIINFVIGAFEN